MPKAAKRPPVSPCAGAAKLIDPLALVDTLLVAGLQEAGEGHFVTLPGFVLS
jgi:hypothetical protein